MRKSVSHEELSSFCTEMSMLIHSGAGISDALALLADENGTWLEKSLSDMAMATDSGASLADAMRCTGVFPSYVCGLTETGEKTGRLEESLDSLARYYEERTRLDRRIRSALLYPAVMLVLMLAVIAVILIKVMPIFSEVYASLGGSMTGVAGTLLNFGSMLSGIMPVLWVLLIIAAVFLGVFASSASFRGKLTALWRIKMGDFGIAEKMNNAKISQILAMGMASGLPIEESLNLAADMLIDIPSAKNRVEKCRDELTNGTDIYTAMKYNRLLPAAQCRLLELGHKTGAEDSAMDKIARDLSEESEAALDDKVSRVEPALVLVCSVLVGLILLSVMLPLTQIMTAIG